MQLYSDAFLTSYLVEQGFSAVSFQAEKQIELLNVGMYNFLMSYSLMLRSWFPCTMHIVYCFLC